MLRRVALVRTDAKEESIASTIMVNRISELVTMLAVANIEEWCLLGCYAVLLL
jgi:hypothetical protein